MKKIDLPENWKAYKKYFTWGILPRNFLMLEDRMEGNSYKQIWLLHQVSGNRAKDCVEFTIQQVNTLHDDEKTNIPN